MTTFNTGNPLGSTDVYDRYDNSENLDNFSNGPLDAYPDRFGVSRQSLQGIRNASQYVDLGPYGPGLNFTAKNEVFSYLGEFYAPGPSITLPYTTTGAGAGEIANFRSVGDAVLRADLANADLVSKGAGAVARAEQVVTTLDELRLLNKGAPSKYAQVVGGGNYMLDVADTTSPDNGRTIIVAADGGRWKQVPAIAGHVVKFSGTMPAAGATAAIPLGSVSGDSILTASLRVNTVQGHYLFESTGNPIFKYALRVTGTDLVIATGPNASSIAGRPYLATLILT